MSKELPQSIREFIERMPLDDFTGERPKISQSTENKADTPIPAAEVNRDHDCGQAANMLLNLRKKGTPERAEAKKFFAQCPNKCFREISPIPEAIQEIMELIEEGE